MSEDKHKKIGIFPMILIVGGFLELGIPSIIALFILPKLSGLYTEAGVNYNPIFSYSVFGFVIFFYIAQIIYGIKLLTSQKKDKTLSSSQENIGIILGVVGIILQVLLVPIMIMTIISPIYQLTNSIN